jgi:glycosyltransferase involved in cell wall biosynthesis
MKIVFSSNISWSIYNFRRSLLKELQSEGHKIYTVANKDAYAEKLVNEGFQFTAIDVNNNSKNPLEDLKTIYAYYKIYKKINPAIICHNAIKPNIYGTIAAKLLGIPVVNNISGLGTLFIRKNFSTSLAKILYKFSQKFAHTVFFQNSYDSSLFINENLIDYKKVKLIPGSGVDISLFKPNKKNKTDIFNFIFIGRFLKDKGMLELYDAVISLSKIRNDFKVILLGGRYASNETCITEIQLNLFKTNNLFDVIGHTDNVQDQLIKADCLILPSYREGLSKVLIEAGSCGIPCITTDVPGCKDVIIDNYNGLIVKPKNSESLLLAMQKMLDFEFSTLSSLAENSRNNIKENFSMKKVNNIYINEIYNILNK